MNKFITRSIYAILTIAAIGYGQISSAQGVEREMKTSSNASQIYLEVGGPALIYSINYDGRFQKMENGLGFRIGLGGASYDGDGYVAIPFQLNYLFGTRGQYLELGAGASYISIKDFFNDNNSSDNQVYGTMTVGFRKQPFGKKGLTWRLAFNPIINGAGFFPYGGASIGYRF